MEYSYNIETNEFQTPIDELGLEQCPLEVKELFLDCIYNVPFIRALIAPDRKRAKDLPRDNKGRIIVDITKPHVLEDTDYFRPSAIKFLKDGRYTDLRPNPNPNSEYGKWLREEVRRCYEGYVRDYDGEWITGDMYFFLNYCPIQLIKKDSEGKSIRTLDFPRFWEGHYYKFHYINQCRAEGKHGVELSKRGSGKSFSGAALLAKRFILGESESVNMKVQCMATASEKKYLTGGNLVLDMFLYYIDFCADNTQFPYKRITSSLLNMLWTMGYIDLNTNTRRGTLNSVMGITSKDDESKLRGTRGVFYLVEEGGCHLKGTKVMMSDGSIKKVEDVKVNDTLMGEDGKPKKVEQLHSGVDDMYKITLHNGDILIVNSTHPIYYLTYNWNLKKYTEHLNTAPELLTKNISKGYYIRKSDKVCFPELELIIDPYWLGLWLGDGDKTRLTVSNEDIEVLLWLEDYCKNNNFTYNKNLIKGSKKCYNFHISNYNRILWEEFKELKLQGNKHIPYKYKYNSKENVLKVIAGLIDTDGTYDKRKHMYEITQLYTRKHILEDIKFMCEYVGLKCSLSSKIAGPSSKGAGNLNYRLRITGNIQSIPVRISRKKPTSRSGYKNKRCWLDYSFKVEYYGKGEYYGFTIGGNHLFLLSDFTIVHNTFPRLKALYQVLRPSVEDGNAVFGTIYIQGTAGDNDSDFSAMLEIMYNPKGYRVKELDNVFDKEGQGRREFSFFFPAYINRADCYNKDGMSDVTKALLEILMDRYTTKHNSTDINAISKRISEYPITPLEAILRTKGNMFPVTQLNERINEIDNNPNFYDDTYVGDLVMKKDGSVEFKITNNTAIRDFPLKDNKALGAIEIYQMPEKDKEGKVYRDRYIMGHDPVDSDVSGTMSLSSTFVLDLFTDKIVAEYTGRSEFADDNFEKVRLLCLFYNAKCLYENNLKGLYSYFSRLNCTHLLADTPEYLKDKQLIKSSGWGNAAKGVTATVSINNYANELIKAWLLKPVPTIVEDAEGQHEINVLNLYFIKNRALLKELVAFNPFVNVDRVRALGILMLYREEKLILYRGDVRHNSLREDPNFIGNDDFFTRNYDEKFANSKFNKTNIFFN